MRTDHCVACGEQDKTTLEHHHLIPRSLGGCDDDKNIITLCAQCHGKVHGINRSKNHKMLTMLGLQAAKNRGVKLGSPDAKRAAEIARAAKFKKAVNRAENIAPIIRVIMAEDAKASFSKIARILETRAVKTPNGGAKWQAVQVQRVLEKAL